MASKPLRFHPEAQTEYLRSLRWYRQRSPIAARNFERAIASFSDAGSTPAASTIPNWEFRRGHSCLAILKARPFLDTFADNIHVKAAALTLADIAQLSVYLRKLNTETRCMEDVAAHSCRYLYENLLQDEGSPACALVRFFVTHPYGQLPAELQAFARSVLRDIEPSPAMRCLTLLGTAGEMPQWNSRQTSRGHKTIPLHSEKFVTAFPMISNLLNQLGLEIERVVHPSADFFREQGGRSFNVFHVPSALGSPLVPAQADFVVPYRIQSVLGFGGLLPSGDIFAVILFTKLCLSQDIAELFKPLSLSLKLAVMEHAQQVFA